MTFEEDDVLPPPLTMQDIISIVNQVANMSGEPEGAHHAEDALYRRLLEDISLGRVPKHEIAAMCATALLTQEYDFPRWCA